MNCVNSVNYSILMNGSQFGFLQPGRGLRQGDPLSPYLFIYVIEAFIALISQAERRGRSREFRSLDTHRPSPPCASHMILYYFVKPQRGRRLH